MRPCKHHPPHPTCYVCRCCADLTDPVNKLRREKWGEPEPNSPAGLSPNRYVRKPCKHLGEKINEEVQCAQCGGYHLTVPVHTCGLWKECTVDKIGRRINSENIAKYLPNCKTCKQYNPEPMEDVTSEFIPGEKDPIQTQPNQNLGWAHFPVTIKEHNLALKELLNRKLKGPEKAEGRGVILCGGAAYWPMLMLSLKMLRDVSNLPVQIWHKGDDEPIPMQDLEGIPNVSVHSVWDTKPRPRIVNYFEVKTHALIHCGWEEVFYLDADAYLVRDPSPLFKLVKEVGFVYWPSDACTSQKALWKYVPEVISNGMPGVQGGQYLLDRKKCWKELVLSYWMDQHSDFFYQHYQSNDEDSWRVSFSATRNACHCVRDIKWQGPAWLCNYQNQTYVIHRCGGKLWLHEKPRFHYDLPKEQEVVKHLSTLGFDRYSEVSKYG